MPDVVGAKEGDQTEPGSMDALSNWEGRTWQQGHSAQSAKVEKFWNQPGILLVAQGSSGNLSGAKERKILWDDTDELVYVCWVTLPIKDLSMTSLYFFVFQLPTFDPLVGKSQLLFSFNPSSHCLQTTTDTNPRLFMGKYYHISFTAHSLSSWTRTWCKLWPENIN